MTEQEYKIAKFDTLKLGRVKFRVKDCKTQTHRLTASELMEQELKEAKEVKVTRDSVEHHCKICWSEDSSAENPLITPCKCAGSVGLLHFECLRKWLESRMQKR